MIRLRKPVSAIVKAFLRLCCHLWPWHVRPDVQPPWMLQGDVMVAEDLSKLLGPRLVACFLHEVKSVLSTVAHLRNSKSNQASWLAAWRDRKIYMHRSHLGMAVQVFSSHTMLLPTKRHQNSASAEPDSIERFHRRIGLYVLH